MTQFLEKFKSAREEIYIHSSIAQKGNYIQPLICDANGNTLNSKEFVEGNTYRIYPRGQRGFYKTVTYKGVHLMNMLEIKAICRIIEQPISKIKKIAITYIH